MTVQEAAETRLKAARLSHEWKKARVIAALRSAAARRGITLPSDASLRRMMAYWENGYRDVSDPLYRELFCEAYQLPARELGFLDDAGDRLASEVHAGDRGVMLESPLEIVERMHLVALTNVS